MRARNARNVGAYQRQGCDISRNRSGSPPPPAMVSLESSPARRPAVGNDERERDHHYRVVAGLRSIFTNSAQPNPPINAPNGVRNNHGIGFLSIGFRESRIVLLNSSQGLYFYQHFRSGLQTCDARLVGNLFPLSSGGRGYNPRSIPCE